ncbi:hypothetical protein BJ875DRAFT_57076 [Amylocarpus encephaloides]|uniref:Uncharacterized protein n=1 Tax=Amylocarpus encephaloides TaxID=45428 RepID=A0A9P8C8Z9_9HELO|nr:hypothetical protein BJ875DRAFT_57076 [Amylocarpus encephaloides]
MDDLAPGGKENEKKSKHRFMNKLFKEKEKPSAAEIEGNVNDFLHGPSTDKLPPMPTPAGQSNPPPLTRLDTSSARRWPTAAEINSIGKQRRHSASPKRSRKGRMVRFTNDRPELIGEGGDEATTPVTEIGIRRRAHTHPAVGHQAEQNQHLQDQVPQDSGFQSYGAIPPSMERAREQDPFQPGPLRRTVTGFTSIHDQNHSTDSLVRSVHSSLNNPSPTSPEGKNDAYDPTSFAARVRAEMRSGEGKALVQAATTSPIVNIRPGSAEDQEGEITPQLKELRTNTIRNSFISPASTNSIPASLHPGEAPKSPVLSQRSITDSPGTLSRTSTLQDAALAVADDALLDFSRRVNHLFALFRLSTEALKPLTQCSFEELTRIALWWFLKGRMNLEATVRDRPTSPESQRRRLHVLQQAHADLAKSLWIAQVVTGQHPEVVDRFAAEEADPSVAAVLDSRQAIISNLRKLSMSMKRNGFLPPDRNDTPLPQGLDNSIWNPEEGNRSLLTFQRQSSLIVPEAFPIGDTSQAFHFARFFADGILEEDAAAQHYRCPVLISLVRRQDEKELSAIVASQDGGLKLCISADGMRGPTWDDVVWQQKSNSLKVELPRGFALRINCSEQDFRMIWATYDYQAKVHASLEQRRNEALVFEAVLKTFQYIDPSPDSRFPKEPLHSCRFRLFEKNKIDKGAAAARTLHQGFRLAMNTHSKTKNVRGIDESLMPNVPIQFGFLRGESGHPAMLLKIATSRSNYKMIMTFEDSAQRSRLHQLITGTALGHGEDVVAEAPMKAFSLTSASSDAKDMNCLKTLDWKGFRVINADEGDLESNKTVLSDHLRMALDFKTGSLTDRISVGTGELKMRLDVKSSKQLKVFREPQEDITLSVIESQVSHELPLELAELLDTVARSHTVRTYLFPGLQDLHLFQAALTGFVVHYDGMAASFNIARRRMVVPIYKKWDASSTRLQVVKREKVVQLLAFFEGFSHGDCMSMPLKSTDIFETSGKSGKYALRIVDAKFPLPKARKQGEDVKDHEFVCLDVPEYPGEHDDITIIFDTESGMFHVYTSRCSAYSHQHAERDKFVHTLPAPAKVASRMGSVRR